MSGSVVRLMLTCTLMTFVITNFGFVEQSTKAVAEQEQPKSAQQSAPRQNSQRAPSEDAETQESLAFTGRLVKVKGRILLTDPVTKMDYELDNASKAKPFVGRKVKVIGRLNLNSNTIHVDSIGPTS